MPSLAFFRQLPGGARINHLPGIAALTSPTRLAATLEHHRRRVGDRPGVLPTVELASPSERSSTCLGLFVLVVGVDPLRLHLHARCEIRPGSGETQSLASVRASLHGLGRDPSALEASLSDAALGDLVTSAVVAAYDPLVRRVRDHLRERAAPFELLRFDVAIDLGERPRLVRCALSPPLTDDAIVDDTLVLLGLLPSSEETGRAASDGYRCLVPAIAPARLLRTFPLPRWSDIQLAGAEADDIPVALRAARSFFDGAIVLFQEETGRFHLLNDTAGYVWVRSEEGLSPEAIAQELAAQFAIEADVARADVWEALARWAHDGWVTLRDAPGADAPSPPAAAPPLSLTDCRFSLRGVVVARPGDDATALIGPEMAGAGAVAAMLTFCGHRVVSSVVSIDEATGCAPAGESTLVVHEGDDATVAARSEAYAANPPFVASSEIGARHFAAPAWEGPPPVVSRLVFLRRARRNQPSTFVPLAPRRALLELAGLDLVASPPWTAARARRFLDWLEETPIFELHASDADAAAALLAPEGGS